MNQEEQNKVIKAYQADKSAQSAFRWGVGSLFAWLLPIVGLPVAIVGLVKATNGEDSKEFNRKAGLGRIFCWVGLVLSVLNALVGIMMK